ncbi:MAG: hypothetical protein HZA54_07845 [Planctomycetes bacterium]|nr:hypothetical protein [Planctomycetota bacterium]
MQRSLSLAVAAAATAAAALLGSTVLRAQEPPKDEHKIEGNPKALKARDNVANATAIAKKWKADAVLVSIKGIYVKEDGTVDVSSAEEAAAYWGYYFFSPATKTEGEDDSAARLSVVLAGGKVEQTPSDNSFVEKVALPDDFIDSDKVWAAAKKADAALTGTAMVDLSHHEESTDHPHQWVFTSETGFTGQYDAKTGDPVAP